MINYFKTIFSTFLFFLSSLLISHAREEGSMLLGNYSTNGANVAPISENKLLSKPENKIIVAVMDGGVDPDHEDLKDVMWVNPGENPGNSQDDDQNGYADDVYGWNFIGGPDGRNVNHDTYEITRVYNQLHKKYAGVDRASLKKIGRAH